MLANLFRRSVAVGGLNNPSANLYEALTSGFDFGGPVNSGASVTTTTALRVVAVLSCVRLIAETGASLPLAIYRKEERGRKQITIDSEAYLWQRPNPEMTRQTFWETAIGTCVLTGNSYTYIVRDGLSRIAELWPLDPRRVTPYRDDKGRKRYTVDGQDADPDDIMHVPGYGDGMKGLNPIAQAREALGLALSAEEFGSSFFGRGSTLNGILTTEGKLDDATADKLEKRWNTSHSGVRNAHKTAIMEGGLKYQQIGITPEDGQFLETRRFQVEEIARLFRVPPHMIGAIDKTTSWGTGIEQQNIGFVTYTLRPWLTRFEQAISDTLLRPANHYAQWNVNGLMRGDSAQRAAFYQTMRNIAAMNPNEIRGLEDWAPYEGGDDYDLPLNSSSSGKDASAPAETAPKQEGANPDE